MLKRIAPRDEREITALFQERKAATCQVNPAGQSPFNSIARLRLDERLTQFSSQLVAGTKELTALKHHDSVGANPNAVAIDVGQLLFHKPLLPKRQGRTDVAPKT